MHSWFYLRQKTTPSAEYSHVATNDRTRRNVRFGSLADILKSPRHVRDSSQSGHSSARFARPLCQKRTWALGPAHFEGDLLMDLLDDDRVRRFNHEQGWP